MKVVLRPEAVTDVHAAKRWYRDAEAGLDDRFLDELDRLLTRLTLFPKSAPEVSGYAGVRRALMRTFPFAVLYLAQDDVLSVLRVLHTGQDQA